MIHRCIPKFFFMILATLALGACLGELQFPAPEAIQPTLLAPPPVDPTVASSPRLSLGLAGQPMVSSLTVPQVRHDLIGRSDCLMCHKQGVSDAPRVPDAHRGLESTTCLNCHPAPASLGLSGPELYLRLCSRCHGENGEGIFGPALNVKSFLSDVSDDDLRDAIMRGRGTSEMLSWGDLGLLTDLQIDELVAMIRAWEPTAPEVSGASTVETVSATRGDPEEGSELFAQFCSGCHGLRGETDVGEGHLLREAVGSLDDASLARRIRGGSEQMPPFHALLTTNDLNDLLALLRSWYDGFPPPSMSFRLSGEEVYARVCARCHGRNGEGGIGFALNSREFLTANDDEVIRQWIYRGTLGTSMLSWGDLGLLTPDQIDELVDFIRAWEATAPSTGSADRGRVGADLGDATHGEQLFAQYCSGCHGPVGERQTAGIILNSAEFLDNINDEIIASQIQNGGLEMPSFHAILTTQDLNDILAFMRSGFSGMGAGTIPSFAADVLPILTEECASCHGTAGGWSAATYDDVVDSGEHAPAVLPGDPENSPLVHRLLGTQTIGGPMPPFGPLSDDVIDLIIRWIAAGAPNN